MKQWITPSVAPKFLGLLLVASTTKTLFVSERQLASLDSNDINSSGTTYSPQLQAPAGINVDYPFTFSACVIARDDNLLLPEWIAYHYTVLPLRHLVLAADPLSITSPLSIVDQFRKALPDLTIELWTGNSYWAYDGQWSKERFQNFDPHNHTVIHGHTMHRHRQKVFYTQCLQHLKNTSQTEWTVLVDTDEYFAYNPPLNSKGDQPHDEEFRNGLPKRIGRPNETIAHWIRAHQKTNTAIFQNTTVCRVLPRLFFSAKDDNYTKKDSNTAVQQQFHSLRFQSHGRTQKAQPGKSIVWLRHLQGHKRVDNPHNPFPNLCDTDTFQSVQYKNTPFRVHHYSGSLESWLSRPTRTKAGWIHRNDLETVGRDPSLQDWYQHFEALVGSRQVAMQLTIEAHRQALEEWKGIKERVEQHNETIPLAFEYTQPGVWEGNVF